MKIVIADGYTLNPGDLDWSGIYGFGEVDYYDSSPAKDLPERCADAEIIITNKAPITSEVISTATKLRLIAVTATGYNVVDVAAASRKGITVCNVPEYGTYSVAQHSFALLLELVNHVGLNSDSVRKGEWSGSSEWCYSKKPLIELKDKILGVVGFGKIGMQTALVAKALGMQIRYSNRSQKSSDLGTQVSLEVLFRVSDFITLHCPLTAENREFVNKELLSLAKPSAYLINTSRGQLINENDLASALRAGKLAGAALDVLSAEPPPTDHPLIGLRNCIITPHTAWMSHEARARILKTTVENINAFLKGRPQNLVSA